MLETKAKCFRMLPRMFKCSRWSTATLVWCCIAVWLIRSEVQGLRKYSSSDMQRMRERVRQMFQHAYDGYLQYGVPYDELRPLSCDGIDTWGSYSLTLIDALDTLAVMGNYTEFGRVVQLLRDRSFDADINVSVFETNIRIIGGLLSAHLLSNQADLQSMGLVEPGWPCEGPLLRMAEDVAQRLLPAFDTATGMPYGTVNLRHGVPYGETAVTCTAGIGTFILEFGTLSRLTGNPVYEDVAMNALGSLYDHRSAIGLYGNHIDVQTGRWIAQDAGIGAGVDSYFEYLVKGAILLEEPSLMATFLESKAAIDRYLKREDWYVWVSMSKGQLTLPVFQSLEAYWPGLLSLYGNTKEALRVLHNYQTVWRQYGFLPEFYNIPTGEAGTNRENYPLRPELIESVMYLYRATRDPFLLEVGENMLESIEHSAKTACGYATIRNVLTHQQEDRMESFFLAETTKYLYLLFDPSNALHNDGSIGTLIQPTWHDNGKSRTQECVVGAGGHIFNTEAHPIDPMALRCCEARRNSLFVPPSSETQSERNAHRGELFFQRNQRKARNLSKKGQPWEPVARNDATFASTVVTKDEEKMTTISLPTSSAMNRDIENYDGTTGAVKTKTISSTVTVLNAQEKKPIVPVRRDGVPQADTDDASQPEEPSPLAADSKVPPYPTITESIIKGDNAEKSKSFFPLETERIEDAPMSTDQSDNTVIRSQAAVSEERKENEADKTVTTLVKLVQNLFHTTVGQQGQGRAKFDREKFYQLLARRRSAEEANEKLNISATSASPASKEKRSNELLLCRAQPYLQRLTLMGEFY
uniref:alpha-1,2-Mannosidase n=1 Tax=Anopheles farauti TaxID=69004 RepID=A0A182QEQ0_9DIPT